MSDPVHNPLSLVVDVSTDSSLYMWRGAGILLIGEHEAGRWVLARAWLHGDRLAHVRRWSFREPLPFSGQVRRLVMEACANAPEAQAESQRALAWTESISS